MKSIIGLFFILFSSLSLATVFNDNNSKTVLVSPNLSGANIHSSGDIAHFSGSICTAKATESEIKCQNTKLDDFTRSFYFPDFFTEVTDQVVISGTKNNGKGKEQGQDISYSFESSPLNPLDPNAFTVIIGQPNERSKKLLRIQAKIQKRIVFLDHRLLKAKSQEQIEAIKEIQEELREVDRQISKSLSKDEGFLARVVHPLQVDNLTSANFEYSARFNGHLLSIMSEVGRLFEGQTANIDYLVQNNRIKQNEGDWSLKVVSTLGGESSTESIEKLSLGGEHLSNLSEANQIPGVTPVSLSLIHVDSEGVENLWGEIKTSIPVTVDNVAPEWFDASQNEAIIYKQNFPKISARISDSFGRVNPGNIHLYLDSELIDGTQGSITVDPAKVSKLDLDEGRSFYVESSLAPLPEGLYSYRLSGSDFAGNLASNDPVAKQVRVDRTAPGINFGSYPTLTNDPSLSINVVIDDFSPTSCEIVHNNQSLGNVSDQIFDVNLTLEEGMNILTAECLDAAGNKSPVVGIYNIELDTISPDLSEFIPKGPAIFVPIFEVGGKSNEKLSAVFINGEQAELYDLEKAFRREFQIFVQGTKTFEIRAYDLAGNESRYEFDLEVILKVINGDLITVNPSTDGSGIYVNGVAGAIRPNIEFTVDGGFFNSKTLTANADGSFEVLLDYFSSVTVGGYDELLDRYESVTLNYNRETTLKGRVLSYLKEPLPGVKVSMRGSEQVVETDAAGVFVINNPSTGDQVIEFDGSEIPVEIIGPNKKYGKTSLFKSIGLSQHNVLDRDIFLVPQLIDGTETEIVENSGATVTSPHAPGVILEIPANTITFPNGTAVGEISMLEIASEVASIPPAEFAVPDTVYALEPSGVKFTKPVQITLPNDNELPEGTDFALVSKNSESGAWEIDGVATVDPGGETITTKEGMGITHFSEVYAVPIAPKLVSHGLNYEDEVIGGDLKTSISLPSVKRYGRDLAPSLFYKSSWAKPSTVVSSAIAVHPNEDSLIFDAGKGSRSLFHKEIKVGVQTSWVTPESITAWFESDQFQSPKMDFGGTPGLNLISYATDLDQIPNGIHPYLAKYEIRLKKMTIRTIHSYYVGRSWGGYGIANPFNWFKISNRSSSAVEEQIKEIFPVEAAGNIYVQNKQNSAAGQGWKLGLAQNIVNPDGNRILLEEEDGTVSPYVLDNPISTVYNPGKHIYAANLNTVPWVLGEQKHPNQDIYEYDPITQIKDHKAEVSDYTGTFGLSRLAWGGPNLYCEGYDIHFRRKVHIDSLIKLEDGKYFFSDNLGTLNKVDFGQTSTIAGRVGTPPQDWSQFNNQWLCSWPGTSCGSWVGRFSNPAPACWFLWPHNGVHQLPGFQDGSLSGSAFNTPKGITAGIDSSSVIVADMGNNRVRKVDLVNNVATTFAGNGQTYDNGDGGLATEASLYHPKGVLYDKLGNLYISTERGLIRKVDTNGKISTFAGKLVSQGGRLTDQAHASEFAFNAPAGMVIDYERGFFYVADEGNHRVVQIDLTNLQARIIAGSGKCVSGNIGDDGPALGASLCNPTDLGLDENGNLLILDKGHNRVRKVILNEASGDQIAFSPLRKDNSVLIKNLDGSFTRKLRNGTAFHFNSEGKHVESDFRVGSSIFFEYQGGELSKVSDDKGDIFQIGYNANGLESITDSAGRTSFFDMQNGRLASVMTPDQLSETFTYDQEGLLRLRTNKRNHSVEYVFNQYNRLEKTIFPDGSEVKFLDSKSGSVGNAYTGGNVGQLGSLGSGSQTDGIINAKNIKTELKKDESGFVSEILDPAGNITKIERDLEGRPVKIIRPDTSETLFTYNGYGDLIKKEDSGTGVSIDYAYNNEGQLLSQTLPGGGTVSNIYQAGTGLLLQSTNQLGQSVSYEYFPDGLLKSRTNSLNQISRVEYDMYGNVASQYQLVGANEENRVDLERDSAGNVIKITNAKGQITSREYSEMNRLLSVTTPKGEKTNYEYLSTGQLSKIIDPLGNNTFFAYSNMGRLVKKTDPNGFETFLEHDQNGNVVKEIDPNGNVKQFVFNSLDQLTDKILPDNHYQYSYNLRGNLESVSDNDSKIDFTYIRNEAGYLVDSVSFEGLGNLADFQAYTLNYGYDISGNRTSTQTPFGNFSYEFDSGNRLRSLTNHRGEQFFFDFDNGNRLSKITRPGSETTFTFDQTNFLNQILHRQLGTGNTISQFDYVKDSIGNRVEKHSLTDSEIYAYDANNQITSVHDDSANLLESFQYDQIGNRTQDIDENFLFEPKKQRIIEDALHFYYHDNNGNMTAKHSKLSDHVTQYIYSSENQLVGIKWYNGTNLIKEAAYSFDALGRRVQKVIVDYQDSSKSFTRRLIHDGNEILAQLDENNNPLSIYTHSGLRTDDVLAVDITTEGKNAGVAVGDGSFFHLKDGLGSITEITTNDGTLKQRIGYNVFGGISKIVDASGADVSTSPILASFFTFTNRTLDSESLLYDFRARTYDSRVGIFYQVDPFAGDLIYSASINNKYVYAVGNPVMEVDPNGEVIGTILLGIAIGAIVGGLVAESTGGDFFEGFLIGGAIGGGLTAGYAVGAVASSYAKVYVGEFLANSFLSATVSSWIISSAGFGAAVLVGSLTGAVVGGAFGAAFYGLGGQSGSRGGEIGFKYGYASGGIGGATSFYTDGRGLQIGDKSIYGKLITNKIGFGVLTGVSALLPFGIYQADYKDTN